MEDGNKRRSTAVISLLVLTIILQISTLAAPGWMVEKQETSRTYYGIFYTIHCNGDRSDCETISVHDYYSKIMAEQPENAGIAKGYHMIVSLQTFMIVSLSAAILCLVLQVYKHRQTVVNYPLMTVLTCSCMTISGALMISQLSPAYININYFLNDSNSTSSMGFPYCVLLYSVALLTNIIIFLIYMIDVSKQGQHQQQDQQRNGAVGIAMTDPRNSNQDDIMASPPVKSGMYSQFS